MSRGPGRCQQLILQTLETCEGIYLRDLLPRKHTRSAYMSLLRAALTLRNRGVIDIRYAEWISGMALVRHGSQVTPNILNAAREARQRLSVSKSVN